MKITVIGDGAFGTALAQLCARNNHDVTMWCYNAEVANSIEQKRCNERYLPTIILDERISAVTSMEEAMKNTQWIIEAVPVKYMNSVLTSCKPFVNVSVPWVTASKGIEYETMRLPGQLLSDALEMPVPYVVIAGPSFADELAKDEPTAVMLASDDLELAHRFSLVVENNSFFSHLTHDTRGVQWCGVIKNCIALALGILEGSGYGNNTQALILTQAIAELTSILQVCGGDAKTVLGLAGIGDIVLTAYSAKSRNKMLGMQLAKGQYDLLEISNAEGVNSLHAIKGLSMQKRTIPLPLFSALYDIVFHKKNAHELIAACSQLSRIEKG